MLGKTFAGIILGGYLLAGLLRSGWLAATVTVVLIYSGAAFIGHQQNGWKGAGYGVVALICISLTMRFILGSDPHN